MAFYQKYRPKVFSEILGEDHISGTLREAVKTGRLSHAYLLSGPRGTGKTTTARLLAKAFNCEEILKGSSTGEPCNQCQACIDISQGRAVDVIEIDAASHTKVDEIREVIDQANYVPAKLSKKIYIIDEVHMLSNSSFNALLKTLEEPPAHVVFILATTEAHKLPATILSRTQRFDFKRISKEAIIQNLSHIAKEEKINIEPGALELMALSAEGGHRDAIGLLEQVASVSKKVDQELVRNILGLVKSEEVFDFLGAIFNTKPEEGLKIAHRLFAHGINMAEFNKEVIEALRKILLIKITGEVLFEDTNENLERIKKIAKQTNEKLTINVIEIFIKAGQKLKESSYPILPIEMAVVESCGQLSTANTKVEIPNSKQITNPNFQNAKFSGEKDIASDIGPGNKKKNDANIKAIEQSNSENVIAVKAQGISNETIKAPNNDSVPVAVFQMTDDLWQRVILEAKKENTTLAALLKDAKPLEVSGNKVKLGVKFPFHKDKISEPKNCAFLEKIFSQITGTKCIIGCEIADLKSSKKNNGEEDLVKAAEEIFS